MNNEHKQVLTATNFIRRQCHKNTYQAFVSIFAR